VNIDNYERVGQLRESATHRHQPSRSNSFYCDRARSCPRIV